MGKPVLSYTVQHRDLVPPEIAYLSKAVRDIREREKRPPHKHRDAGNGGQVLFIQTKKYPTGHAYIAYPIAFLPDEKAQEEFRQAFRLPGKEEGKFMMYYVVAGCMDKDAKGFIYISGPRLTWHEKGLNLAGTEAERIIAENVDLFAGNAIKKEFSVL